MEKNWQDRFHGFLISWICRRRGLRDVAHLGHEVRCSPNNKRLMLAGFLPKASGVGEQERKSDRRKAGGVKDLFCHDTSGPIRSAGICGRRARWGPGIRAAIGQQANDQPADRAEQKAQCKAEAESASRFADERADTGKSGNDEDPQVIAGPFSDAIAPSDFHPVVVHGE